MFASRNSRSNLVSDKQAYAIWPSITRGGCRNNLALVPVKQMFLCKNIYVFEQDSEQ